MDMLHWKGPSSTRSRAHVGLARENSSKMGPKFRMPRLLQIMTSKAQRGFSNLAVQESQRLPCSQPHQKAP